MTMLADQVDVVIGVDTHKHTNTAAVVRASTGGGLDEATVPTTPAGHEELLALARSHGPLRAWAIEGTSSYGTGLTRFLRANDEWVFELERPARTDRRGGKKNDPLDAALGTRGASQDPISASPIDR
jgi:transposase